MFASARSRTTGIAAVTAGVVTLSLAPTPPPNFDIAVSRAETRAIELISVTAADVRTAVMQHAAAVASALTPPGATTPTVASRPSATSVATRASATAVPDIAVQVGGAVIGAVIAPIWYLTFPITFPLLRGWYGFGCECVIPLTEFVPFYLLIPFALGEGVMVNILDRFTTPEDLVATQAQAANGAVSSLVDSAGNLVRAVIRPRTRAAGPVADMGARLAAAADPMKKSTTTPRARVRSVTDTVRSVLRPRALTPNLLAGKTAESRHAPVVGSVADTATRTVAVARAIPKAHRPHVAGGTGIRHELSALRANTTASRSATR